MAAMATEWHRQRQKLLQAAVLDLGLVLLALVTQRVLALQQWPDSAHGSCSSKTNQWALLMLLLLLAILGSEGYFRLRAFIAFCQRLLFATGLVIKSPNSCEGWCLLVWRFRLLPPHVASMVGPGSSLWLVWGMVPVWLLAMITDAAGLQAGCGPSLACFIRPLQHLLMQAKTEGPAQLAQQVLTAAISPSSLIHLACAVVPAILIVCQQRIGSNRGCPVWQQQKQQQPPSKGRCKEVSAATATPAGLTCNIGPGMGRRQTSVCSVCNSSGTADSSRQQQHQQQDEPLGPSTPDTMLADNRFASWPQQDREQQQPSAATAVHKRVRATPGAARFVAAIQRGMETGQAFYHSPVVCCLLTFKLRLPHKAALSECQALEKQLVTAVQKDLQRMVAGEGGPCCHVHLCHVLDRGPCLGSWQVVLRAVFPRSRWPTEQRQQQQQQPAAEMELLEQEQLLQEHQHLHQVAQQVLQSWAGWSLIDVQQTTSRGPLAAAASFSMPNFAETAHSGVSLQQVAIPLPAAEVDASRCAGASSCCSSVARHGASALSVAVPCGGFPETVAAPLQIQQQQQQQQQARSHQVGVCISGSVLQQLQAAGCRALQVMLMQQPQGQLLQDKRWSMQDLVACVVQAASREAVPATQGAASAASPSSAASAVELLHQPQDVCLQLCINQAALLSLLQQPQHSACAAGAAVLSVAVLTDAVAAGLGRPLGTAAAGVGATVHSKAAPSHLIAQLPLLVLPANAHAEIQGLFDAATARGLDEADAYQELLPLLQDWAALMLWYHSAFVCSRPPTTNISTNTSAHWQPGSAAQMSVDVALAGRQDSQTSGEVVTRKVSRVPNIGCHQKGQQQLQQQQLLVYLHEELVASVSSFLDAYELTECFKLLTLQQWQQQHAMVGPGDAAEASSSLASATPVPAGDGQEQDSGAMYGSRDDVAELLAEQLPDEAANLLPYALTTTFLAPIAAFPAATYPAAAQWSEDAPPSAAQWSEDAPPSLSDDDAVTTVPAVDSRLWTTREQPNN